MKKIGLPTLITFVLIFVLMPTVQAQSPQATLNQYVANLQKNPNDNALRQKIIKHVMTMKQKPAVPEEAERFMARGAAALKNAKNKNDFKDAVDEFEKATLAAPWLDSAYYNLGITQEKAGIYPDAIKSFKLYLLSSPNASDTKAVKNLVYELEYKQEQVTKGVISKDDRFIAYSNGTVLDTRTNLMWAAKDNESNIDWQNAKSYCENYRGGGYTDWRMPTQDELAGLYDASKSYRATQRDYNIKLTELIQLSAGFPWASETRGSDAALFAFSNGNRYWNHQSIVSGRALPVRSGK